MEGELEMKDSPPGPLRCASAPYPLHATVVVTGVVGREVEGRGGLSAGQGQVVLAVELQLPHHLCLQPPIQMAAVLQAPPPPSLCAVAVFAHSKPIGCSPEARKGFFNSCRPQFARCLRVMVNGMAANSIAADAISIKLE